VHVQDVGISMKTTKQIISEVGCKRWKVKDIARQQGWRRVVKNRSVMYDVTDEQIKSYLESPPIGDNESFGNDATLELYKLTLLW